MKKMLKKIANKAKGGVQIDETPSSGGAFKPREFGKAFRIEECLPIIRKIIQVLDDERVYKTVGLFRIEGNVALAKEILKKIKETKTFPDEYATPNFADEQIRLAYTYMLKRMLEEVPGFLIEEKPNTTILEGLNHGEKTYPELAEKIKKIVDPIKFQILQTVVGYFAKVSTYAEFNRMHPHNIGKMTAQTIMKGHFHPGKHSPQDVINESLRQAEALEMLIKQYTVFFKGDGTSRPTSAIVRTSIMEEQKVDTKTTASSVYETESDEGEDEANDGAKSAAVDHAQPGLAGKLEAAEKKVEEAVEACVAEFMGTAEPRAEAPAAPAENAPAVLAEVPAPKTVQDVEFALLNLATQRQSATAEPEDDVNLVQEVPESTTVDAAAVEAVETAVPDPTVEQRVQAFLEESAKPAQSAEIPEEDDEEIPELFEEFSESEDEEPERAKNDAEDDQESEPAEQESESDQEDVVIKPSEVKRTSYTGSTHSSSHGSIHQTTIDEFNTRLNEKRRSGDFSRKSSDSAIPDALPELPQKSESDQQSVPAAVESVRSRQSTKSALSESELQSSLADFVPEATAVAQPEETVAQPDETVASRQSSTASIREEAPAVATETTQSSRRNSKTSIQERQAAEETVTELPAQVISAPAESHHSLKSLQSIPSMTSSVHRAGQSSQDLLNDDQEREVAAPSQFGVASSKKRLNVETSSKQKLTSQQSTSTPALSVSDSKGQGSRSSKSQPELAKAAPPAQFSPSTPVVWIVDNHHELLKTPTTPQTAGNASDCFEEMLRCHNAIQFNAELPFHECSRETFSEWKAKCASLGFALKKYKASIKVSKARHEVHPSAGTDTQSRSEEQEFNKILEVYRKLRAYLQECKEFYAKLDSDDVSKIFHLYARYVSQDLAQIVESTLLQEDYRAKASLEMAYNQRTVIKKALAELSKVFATQKPSYIEQVFIAKIYKRYTELKKICPSSKYYELKTEKRRLQKILLEVQEDPKDKISTGIPDADVQNIYRRYKELKRQLQIMEKDLGIPNV